MVADARAAATEYARAYRAGKGEEVTRLHRKASQNAMWWLKLNHLEEYKALRKREFRALLEEQLAASPGDPENDDHGPEAVGEDR